MPKRRSSRSSSSKPTTSGRILKTNANSDLQLLNEHAAGIDIGADRHYVAVGPSASPHPVREFSVFTKDLVAIADWLESCGVKTVAMESTGVYWVSLYEVLDKRGFKVKLVDARKVKNVTGRKSDVLDCQWLQQLESYGLLQAAYRPEDEIVVLRGYMRQRAMLVKSAASHIQHM
jgi:transposase